MISLIYHCEMAKAESEQLKFRILVHSTANEDQYHVHIFTHHHRAHDHVDHKLHACPSAHIPKEQDLFAHL